MPGFQEFIVIALVALIVLGPNRLPTVARQLGGLLARFRAETRQTVSALREEGSLGELEDELRALRRELRDTRGLAARAARDAVMGAAPAHLADATPEPSRVAAERGRGERPDGAIPDATEAADAEDGRATGERPGSNDTGGAGSASSPEGQLPS